MIRKALLVLVLAATSAMVQQPAQAASNVSGTSWYGVESVNGGQNVRFTFFSDGSVLMVDRNGSTPGFYSQIGSQVTMSFSNCVYSGTLQGASLIGRGTFTSGNGQGRTWDFLVANVR